MKLNPSIYINAAKAYDIEWNTLTTSYLKYCPGMCAAIQQELIKQGLLKKDSYIGPYFDELNYFFKPKKASLWWANDYSNDLQEVTKCRVLTLLFMAEIVKDLK